MFNWYQLQGFGKNGKQFEPKTNDDLINYGLYVEAFTYPHLPMPEAIDKVLADVDAGLFNLSTVVPSFLSREPEVTLRKVQELLPGLPHDNNQIVVYIVAPLITALVVITTVMRLYARKKINNSLKMDDWSAAIATLFSVGFLFNYIYPQLPIPAINGASGRHIWDVSFKQYEYFLMNLWIVEVIFSCCLVIVRLSWIFFFYQLSPNVAYRRFIFISGFLIIFVSVACIPIVIFQCNPVDYWNHTFTAKCILRKKVFTSMGLLTILTDLVLLLLPITFVLRLKKMRVWEKVQIVAIFGAGSIVCGLCVMRVVALNANITNLDVTYINTGALCWAVAEMDISIVVSSLPAMRTLFSHWYHGSKLKKGIPSAFVIKTDGELIWKVDEGVMLSDVTATTTTTTTTTTKVSPSAETSQGSNEKSKRRSGSWFERRSRKSGADTSLSAGSLFQNTTSSSRLRSAESTEEQTDPEIAAAPSDCEAQSISITRV